MKVFADTNVLVSAFTSRGLCFELFDLILAEHDLIIGEVVLSELQHVLSNKLEVPQTKVEDVLSYLKSFDIEPRPDSPSKLSIRDHDDKWILESAILCRADILVTGDKDLLEINSLVSEIMIISPRDLFLMLKGIISGPD